MSSLSRELVFLILQFLDEEKFKETVHKCVLPSLLALVTCVLFYALGDLICRAACFRFFVVKFGQTRLCFFSVSSPLVLGFDELLEKNSKAFFDLL